MTFQCKNPKCLALVSSQTACYSRVVFDGGSLAMYHNQRMEENFMKTTELYRRVRQLRLLPLFHWTT